MSFLESIWFKLIVIFVPLVIILGAGVFFVVTETMRREEALAFQEQLRIQDLEWEKQHRTSMVRIYQNLKLDHFLAAFRNFETLEAPSSSKADAHSEYYEALERTAKGLLKDEFLDEAEEAFRELQFVPEYEDEARSQIARIASLRRYESAKSFLQRGIELVEQERYRDAKGELQKAQLELDSVKLYGQDDTSEEEKKLRHYSGIAKHQVYLADARIYLDKAKRQLVQGNYDLVLNDMQYAAGNTGKAAFYNPSSPEVAEIREELLELQAELEYLVPNGIQIYNRWSENQIYTETEFFHLDGYSFEPSVEKENFLNLAMKYRMLVGEDDFYVVRYQVFLFDGRNFFNGHFLRNKDETGPKNIKEIVYVQEVPKDYRGVAVKRIDLRVYDSQNVLVSRAMRAFRAPNSN